MLHETLEALKESGLLDSALNALRGTAYEAVDAQFNEEVLMKAVVAASDPEVTLTKVETSEGDAGCDIYEPGVGEAEAVIDYNCDGSIEATLQIVDKLAMSDIQLEKSHPLYQAVELKRQGLNNLSYQVVVDFNRQLGLYDPTSVQESAALADGTTFRLRDDGTFEIRGPDKKLLLTVDCDGDVTKYKSISMFDSKPCVGTACAEVPPPPPPVAAAEAVAEPAPIRVREQVYWCADDQGTIRAEEVMIFDSFEDAQRFMDNPENVSSEYQASRKCPYVWIANGEGSVQRVEFLRLSDGSEKLDLETIDQVSINDGKADYTRVGSYTIVNRDPIDHLTLPDGEKFEKYITGYAGTSDVRASDGMDYKIEKGETFLPSAPQEYVYDEATDRYVREDLETSATRTVNAWLREAEISAGEWEKIYDMRLPEAFGDSGTSISTRAKALMEAAAKDGVVLEKEDATELARIITAGQGKEAGFYMDERDFKRVEVQTSRGPMSLQVPARTPTGEMITLDEALFGTARSTSIMQRMF